MCRMETLTKNKMKWLQSLSKKRERDEQRLFVAEGAKIVQDLLPSFECVALVGTSEFFRRNGAEIADGIELYEVSDSELERISSLTTPHAVLGVFRKPDVRLAAENLRSQLTLALDTVQDPGNLGTIIRVADWFGIENILCSPDTADAFNPKTVQATMGALSRVRVHYVDLPALLASVEGVPVYGTFLEGDDIYASPLSRHGIVVMGNEGNGISPAVERLVSQKLHIPNYPKGRNTSESLNVAVATSIVCSEFRRRIF